MSVFAAAAAALAADPHLGSAATYTPGGGAPVALRVVRSEPQEAIGGLDGPRNIAFAAAVMIPAASLATRPLRGDEITLGGVDYQVAEVMQDEVAAAWTLHLRRIGPRGDPVVTLQGEIVRALPGT